MGNLFLLRGKNQIEMDKVEAGDIVAVSKLQYTSTGTRCVTKAIHCISCD